MKRPKLPRDPSQRALAVVELATAESAEDFETLAQTFWEETGVIAPGVEIPPPLTDKWGEEERWRRWRQWGERRKMGGEDSGKAVAGRKGGLKGGKARAAKLTPERRREIAKKASAARWSKDDPSSTPEMT